MNPYALLMAALLWLALYLFVQQFGLLWGVALWLLWLLMLSLLFAWSIRG